MDKYTSFAQVSVERNSFKSTNQWLLLFRVLFQPGLSKHLCSR